MSVEVPKVAMVFGAVTVPQGDVVELKLHLGCSKEVSSYEVKLQNWDKKYSPNGTSPITVGMDGHIDAGRDTNVPQLITCRVEGVNYQSTPTENYVTVTGRCWGEKLFRRVVTKTYTDMKGEAIVKDLLDYYAGLSHSRSGTELVEDTDTTFSKLEYSNSPLWDIIKYVAESSDKNGVIGYDFRIAPDGKFEFFPKGTKTNPTSLAEKIEHSEYRRDISRVRNKIVIYGIADKSIPADKDAWTESLAPAGGAWQAGAGTISLDQSWKQRGNASIKLYAQQNYQGSACFTLNGGSEVNCELYPTLDLLLYLEKTYDGTALIVLFDSASKNATKNLTIGPGEWRLTEIGVGAANQSQWETVQAGFDWTHVKQIGIVCNFAGVGTGNFWVDALYFGGRRYAAVRDDATSQSAFGLRELAETDEELWSDNECDLRAKALLAFLKEPAEYLTVTSTVIDYANSPLLPGDRVHVELPNENVDADFRVESVEYQFIADTQTLLITLELGKEPPQLADYLYGLRTFTVNVEKLSRTKLGKRGIPNTVQSGSAGAHQIGHTYGDEFGAKWQDISHGGWDPLNGWIGPTYIGPFNDAAAYMYWRTLNKNGTADLDHHFAPVGDKWGVLGGTYNHWKEVHSMIFLAPDDGFYRVRVVEQANPLSEFGREALKFGPGGDDALDTWLKRVGVGQLELRYDLLPTTDNSGNLGALDKRFGHVYAVNIHPGNLIPTADSNYDLGSATYRWRDLRLNGSISVGQSTIVTSARVLQNVTADASIIASGQLALSRIPRGTASLVLEAEGAGFDPMYVDPNSRYTPAGHAHAAGDITSGTVAEARLPNVYTGQVTFQGGIVTNGVNCANWQLADAVFSNGFRMTEAEQLGFDAGVAFLNPEGDALMILLGNGNLHVAGEVKSGLPRKREEAA
ncbi:MAG: hypothetical protein ACE14S_00595 [Candidatus Bathyarchaeia archaeon]